MLIQLCLICHNYKMNTVNFFYYLQFKSIENI